MRGKLKRNSFCVWHDGPPFSLAELKAMADSFFDVPRKPVGRRVPKGEARITDIDREKRVITVTRVV